MGGLPTSLHDKFNLNRQTSVVFDGISYFTVYADQDIEFNTAHPTYRERVVFYLMVKTIHLKDLIGTVILRITVYLLQIPSIRYKNTGKVSYLRNVRIIVQGEIMLMPVMFFSLADNINLSTNLQNKSIQIVGSKFKYIVIYCFFLKSLEWYFF